MNLIKWIVLGAPVLFVIGCVSFSDAQTSPQLVDRRDMVRDYPAEKIAAHTYVIHGPREFASVANQGFMNNPAFIVTGDGVVVIDPGSSLQAGRMVLKQLRKVTDKPVTHVLNTHVHGDHWLGNHAVREAYPDAVLMAHPEMIKRVRGVAEHWVSMMHRVSGGFTEGTRAVVPTVAIGNGEELKTGGITFRIHAPPGAHSHTDIMIQVLEDSVVFVGDNCLFERLARLDDATFKGNIEACRVAARLKARQYVPGHGPTGGVEIVKAYESYLATLYAEVKKHYDAGKSDFEMRNAVVAKLKPYHNWVHFEDVIGKHISLAFLEIERASFR
jgi:glyoxylase-like metal-dependent hydrolase (beta-lactamase superfamily II)